MSEASHDSITSAAAAIESPQQAGSNDAVPVVIESPPPAAMPARESPPDPRTRLQQLARQLSVASSRRALIEFLQLRRALQ